MRNWLKPADLGKAGKIGPACMHESPETPAKLERVNEALNVRKKAYARDEIYLCTGSNSFSEVGNTVPYSPPPERGAGC